MWPVSEERAARADRFQCAREAFYDILHDEASDGGPVFELADCVRECIETATRVQVTPEVVAAAVRVSPIVLTKDAIAAAFRAAGFEVEE